MAKTGFHAEDVERYLAKRPQIPIGPPPPPPTSVTFHAGAVVIGDLGPAVYWVDMIDGAPALRWVPDPGTLNALFNPGAVRTVYQLALNWAAQTHGGPQIASGSLLVRGSGEAPIYFIDDDTARWITSPQAMAENNFNGSKVVVQSPNLIATLKPGPDVNYSTGSITWNKGQQ